MSSEVMFSSEEICKVLDSREDCWPISILTEERDWDECFIRVEDWPNNIDIFVEKYGRRTLGINLSELSKRRKIKFESSCLRELAREGNEMFRNLIVEVIACRAYNHIKPEHNDETLKGQRGVRRVSVKRMDPPIRLHYYLDDDSIIYTLYTNADHDRGI